MGRPNLNEKTGYLWIEEGEPREGLVADVAPVIHVHRTYSFSVPDSMADSLTIGQRVHVPLGRRGRVVRGFVVDLTRREWDSTLRPIDSIVDTASFLTPDLLRLGREIALHYGCPLGVTLKAMTPEAVRQERGLRKVTYATLSRNIDEIRDSGTRITPPRQVLLDALSRLSKPIPVRKLLAETGVSRAVLNGMEKLGWVAFEDRREAASLAQEETQLVEPGFTLNEEQTTALDAINTEVDANRFSVSLLHGVSGSGKTEVYIRAIRRVVAAGRQAILLVPEIMLTTQIMTRLASRFEALAVVHSGLTGTQRSLIWQQVAAGVKTVVVGTRSAVFAPCPRLGLICVDEEQEPSYKNMQSPRYHVRDVAIMRAQQLGIPVVLGSATPSLETWYRSTHRTDYRRLSITRRVRDLPLPTVHLIDMRDELAERKRALALSRTTERLLSETLDRNEQALLLINRRGYASRLLCPTCKSRIECATCSLPLVVHAADGVALCHYCRRRIPTPTACPVVSCRGQLMQYGLGTQRVEDVLRMLFPKARIQRADSDTIRHRKHYRQMVEDIEARRVDIVVGTQMIAKGLDFPHVSFVGVIDADPSGMATDFRAQERLFQLVTQVAGRAGRAETSGTVVVQTSMPDLPALQCALTHDYVTFADAELNMRRQTAMPPFTRLARIVVSDERPARAREAAALVADRAAQTATTVGLTEATVMPPQPCALARLRGQYRFDLLLRARTAEDLRRWVSSLTTSAALRVRSRSVQLDVDPVTLS